MKVTKNIRYRHVAQLDGHEATNGNYIEVNISGSIIVYGRLFQKNWCIAVLNNYHAHSHEEIRVFLRRFGFEVQHSWTE